MRFNAKRDAKAKEIARALTAAGADVVFLNPEWTPGLPDLLVGYRSKNYLLEIKTPGETLSEPQEDWHALWRGQVSVVYSIQEALEVIGAARADAYFKDFKRMPTRKPRYRRSRATVALDEEG